MKATLLSLLLITLSSTTFAGAKECIATYEGDNSRTAKFIIDWEPDGVTLTFDQQVAWYPDALDFNVVYSQNEENGFLIAAVASIQETSNQLIELLFETRSMKQGTLRAGDLSQPFSRMGKNRKYSVSCN